MTYTLRDLYRDLPGIGPAEHGERWDYPLITELDGARADDPDGFAERTRAVWLDYDDERGLAILRTEG